MRLFAVLGGSLRQISLEELHKGPQRTARKGAPRDKGGYYIPYLSLPASIARVTNPPGVTRKTEPSERSKPPLTLPEYQRVSSESGSFTGFTTSSGPEGSTTMNPLVSSANTAPEEWPTNENPRPDLPLARRRRESFSETTSPEPVPSYMLPSMSSPIAPTVLNGTLTPPFTGTNLSATSRAAPPSCIPTQRTPSDDSNTE